MIGQEQHGRNQLPEGQVVVLQPEPVQVDVYWWGTIQGNEQVDTL